MKENRDKELDLINEIGDDQERLFFQLNLIKDIKFKDDPNFNKKINEFQKLRTVLYFSIFLGINLFFMFILIEVNYIIILIDLGVVISYYLYFRYLKIGYKKNLNITKKHFKFIIKKRNNTKSYSVYQMIFDFLIIALTLFLLFISFLKIEPLIFILIFTISLVFLMNTWDGIKVSAFFNLVIVYEIKIFFLEFLTTYLL